MAVKWNSKYDFSTTLSGRELFLPLFNVRFIVIGVPSFKI